jgi:hypothetical protein
MTDPRRPPQVEKRAPARAPEENGSRTGLSAGLLVACIALAIIAIYIATSIHKQDAVLAGVKGQLARANLRADLAQATLDNAKTKTESLQIQLTSDQGQKSDLQAQLDQAKAQLAGLQAELAKAQSQRKDLQPELDEARAQFTRARADADSLQDQLDVAKRQTADAQAQLAKAQRIITQVHPLIVEARKLPLNTTFEKSFWDQSFTLHINNTGIPSLNLRIAITGLDKPRGQMTVLDGGETVNIERLPPGEKVLISSGGFDPISLTAR